MKKLISIALMTLAALAGYSQPTDPDYDRTQYGANWYFPEIVRVDQFRVANKFAVDINGRIWWYNNTAPAAGSFLQGNGTYFAPLALGTANQLLRVNAGATALEYFTPTYGTGTVTSIATTSPIGGGTITTTGTISLAGLSGFGTAGQLVRTNAGATGWEYFTSTYLTAEVDGSTTNELQTLATTSNATSHTTTLSNSGGSQQLVEGTGITLTTTGTGLDGIVTIATTALLSEVDGSTTNEVQNLSYDAVNREVDISLSGTSATIPLGLDDGATEGLVSFAAADFTVTAGNVVIDYANGQAATSGQDGLLQSADWTTFNNKGYNLTANGTQGTLADGAVYYSGMFGTTSTTAAVNRVPIPVAGTITDISVYMLTSGTLASGESSTLAVRYNNTTDVTISNAVLNTAASEQYTATGLSQAVTAGSYLELKYTSAAWATNPTNVRWACVVYIK